MPRKQISILASNIFIKEESNCPPCARWENLNQAVLLKRQLKLLSDPLLPGRPHCPELRAASSRIPPQPHPRNLSKNKTPHCKVKREKKSQTKLLSHSLSLLVKERRERPLSIRGPSALPLVKMAAIGGAAPSRKSQAAPLATTTHAEPSTPAAA